jgi:archaellum biogenesis ATPase FlaH
MNPFDLSSTEILRTLELIYRPGDRVNIRELPAMGGMRSIITDDLNDAAQHYYSQTLKDDMKSLFLQVQHIRKDAVIAEGQGCKDPDMDVYRWFFIDVDTVRSQPGECSATDAEKTKTMEGVRDILRYLQYKDFPEFIQADSGNGYHLLGKLNDQPCDKTATYLEDCLRALAAKFNSPHYKVDTSVWNASQLAKVYGTVVRKGENTPERPWRKSQLLHVPENLEAIRFHKLAMLSADAPKKLTPPKGQKDGRPELVEGFDIHDFAYHFGLEFWNPDGEQRGGQVVYHLTSCPFKGEPHKGGQEREHTSLFLGDTLGFKCFSDDCADKRIGDLLSLLRAEHGAYKPGVFVEQPFEDTFDDVNLQDFADELDAAAEAEEVEETQEEDSTIQPAKVTKTAPIEDASEDWVRSLLAILFSNPKLHYSDYTFYRTRLGWCAGVLEQPQKGALEQLLKFDKDCSALPTRDSLVEFIVSDESNRKLRNREEYLSYVQETGVLDPTITLSHALTKVIAQANRKYELASLKEAAQLAKQGKISEGRALLRDKWSQSITELGNQSRRGAIQERTEDIGQSFIDNFKGKDQEHVIRTQLTNIDNQLILGPKNQRLVGILGPGNSYKTTMAFSLAYNASKQGHNGLIITGEHDQLRVERQLALLHAFHHRTRFDIPPLTKWDLNIGLTQKHVDDVLACLEEMKKRTTLPGYLEVKNAEYFHNDWGEITQFLERTDEKYQWDFIVIDPFDMFMVKQTADKNLFQLGQNIIYKMFDHGEGYLGRGLMTLVTFQTKSVVKELVEKLQSKDEQDIDKFANIIDQNSIETFKTAYQKCDAMLSICPTANPLEGLVKNIRSRSTAIGAMSRFLVDRRTSYCFDPCPPEQNMSLVIDMEDRL